MSAEIIPKRFGLKYSSKPVIALEYEINGPDPESRVLEVYLEQLCPSRYDVDGVVYALQQTHPRHLGADVVSTAQLESLVSRLLEHCKPHLPGEYHSRGDEALFEEAHNTSPDRSPPPKSSTQGAGISDDHSLGDSDHHLSKESTPASTPKVQRGGLSDGDGALQELGTNLTREGNAGGEDIGVGTLTRNDRLNEVRALGRHQDGVEEKAGMLESKEESEGKEDEKGTAGSMLKANQTALNIHEQAEVTAEPQEGKRLNLVCSGNRGESPGTILTGSSVPGLQLDRNFSADDRGSKVEEENIPEDGDIQEEVSGDFEDDKYFREAGVRIAKDTGSSEKTIDTSNEKCRGKMTIHDLEAAGAVASDVVDESDYINGAAAPGTVIRISASKTEEQLRSGIDNNAGDQEQPKPDDEVCDTDTIEERRLLDAEATSPDAQRQRSDVSLVFPAPPPPRDILEAVLSDGGEFSATPSSFAWSGGSSEQPSSSTGDLTAQHLAGTPHPPLVGVQQRSGLLGNLPPTGDRGPTSIGEAIAANGKPRNADMFERAAFPLSSGLLDSGVAISTNDSDRLSTSSTRQLPKSSEDEAKSTSEGRATDELASGDLKLRTFLGLTTEEAPEDEVTGIKTPESPKQHQGQEEEAAGRRLESEVDVGPGGVIDSLGGGREVADYFADSDVEGEINEDLLGDGSSIDDSISFERESDDDGNQDFFA